MNTKKLNISQRKKGDTDHNVQLDEEENRKERKEEEGEQNNEMVTKNKRKCGEEFNSIM